MTKMKILKKSPQEIKKLESTRKTSSRTDSSTIVTTLKHSSSNRRKKLSVIKKSDDGDGESENASDSNIDNEEEDNDDDNVPLGLRFHHSRSISFNYPPLHANYINLDLVILESENFHLRLHHRHRRALIVMAADIIENIMRILHNIYEYYYDEMDDGYGENRMINIPNDDLSNTPPIEKMRRVSLNSSSPRPRNDSFSRMYSGLTTTRRSNDSSTLVAGANPPPPNKYQKEATKRMSTSEYHKYQQEMVVAQYLKHGISPIIDDSTPVHSEPLSNNPRGPTLIQVQSMMTNISSSRPKCLSVMDRGYSGSNYSSSGSYTSPAELARKNSCTKTVSDCGIGACNGGVNSHRRTHSESNVQISSKFSTRQQQHHYHNTPLYLQHQSHHSSISSSSSSSTYVSSSGSGGPPTPTSRRSSIMFNSNVYGSRPSTPSSVGSGYIFEKEKRRKSVLRE